MRITMFRFLNILILTLALSFSLNCAARQCDACPKQIATQDKKMSCHESGKADSGEKGSGGCCCLTDQADQAAKRDFKSFTQPSFAFTPFEFFPSDSVGKEPPVNYHLKRYRDDTVRPGTFLIKFKQSFLI